MDVLDHKCPSCNAKLPFNPMTQKWDCEYCGNQFDLEALKKYEDRPNKKKQIEADVYSCPNCGAEVVTNKNTSATFCVYCGNTSIIKNRLEEEFKPTYIIPFYTTKEDAIKSFKKFKKGKLFAPEAFNKKENIEKIMGIYVPYWIYDCDVEGRIRATGKKLDSYIRGTTMYIDEHFYSIFRKGSLKVKKIPVDGLSRIDDKIMSNIEPFNYKGLKPFKMSYLSGFFSEKYDINEKQASKTAFERIKPTAVEKLKATIRGYDTVEYIETEIDINTEKLEYVLLPLWILNIEYNHQTCFFAMNGQTGKVVGSIPIDKAKRIKVWIRIFLLTAVISSIIALFLM